MIKDVFYFTLKALFVLLRCLNFCPDFFGLVQKQPDKKTKINFKICDIKNWKTNNYNIHFTQYLKKYSNWTIKFGQLIEYNMRNIFP